MTRHALTASLTFVVLAACGGPSSEPSEAEPAPVAASTGAEAPADPPAPTELCVAHAQGDEITGCALGGGRTMPDGVRVDLLHLSTTSEGRSSTGYHLVFRDAEITQFVDVIGAGDDGNGEESSTCEVGDLAAEGSHVSIEGTQRGYLRGCTGDPSCFDDDSNLELVSHVAARVTCVPRAEVAEDDFEPDYDEEGEEIPVLYVCQRDVRDL